MTQDSDATSLDEALQLPNVQQALKATIDWLKYGYVRQLKALKPKQLRNFNRNEWLEAEATLAADMTTSLRECYSYRALIAERALRVVRAWIANGVLTLPHAIGTE